MGTISEFSGASVGAIVAACASSDMQTIPGAMAELQGAELVPHRNTCQLAYSGWRAMRGYDDGFYSNSRLRQVIGSVLHNSTVSVPRLSIGLTNATTLQQERLVKHKGQRIVPDEVAASCSIPFVFPPLRLNNTAYVDGGIQRSFVRDAVIESLRNADIKYVSLMGCCPWAGPEAQQHAVFDAASLLMRVGIKRWYENIAACTNEYLGIIGVPQEDMADGRFIVMRNKHTGRSTVVTPTNNASEDCDACDKVVLFVAPTRAEFDTFWDATFTASPAKRMNTIRTLKLAGTSAAREVNRMLARCGVSKLSLVLA